MPVDESDRRAGVNGFSHGYNPAMTYRRWLLRASIALNVCMVLGVLVSAGVADSRERLTLWFSPDGGAAAALVDGIRSSTSSLDVAIYHLTHPDIAKAIADAHRRRVTVRVVMDQSQSQSNYSAATYLHNSRVPVSIWGEGMMHHKFIIIDRKVVFTGSFNFTKSADTSNAENLLRISDSADVVEAYRGQMRRLLNQSRAYQTTRD